MTGVGEKGSRRNARVDRVASSRPTAYANPARLPTENSERKWALERYSEQQR